LSYQATLESVRRHAVPDWYHDAKLGIFIHWSLSSVPGFATREHDITELLREKPAQMNELSPYAEWYQNALQFPDSPAAKYHREKYGGRPYADFRRPTSRVRSGARTSGPSASRRPAPATSCS
jgi:alpha-L-fucosidase